jgi:hypothetical protein
VHKIYPRDESSLLRLREASAEQGWGRSWSSFVLLDAKNRNEVELMTEGNNSADAIVASTWFKSLKKRGYIPLIDTFNSISPDYHNSLFSFAELVVPPRFP